MPDESDHIQRLAEALQEQDKPTAHIAFRDLPSQIQDDFLLAAHGLVDAVRKAGLKLVEDEDTEPELEEEEDAEDAEPEEPTDDSTAPPSHDKDDL